ncbi:MAG: Nickel transport protein NikQ [Chloroflexi bacterium ADurb.Bin180]|nr:MAG: Nickel transport protein NikQ [Chloroflexi bacterium ADurb.Bin180]
MDARVKLLLALALVLCVSLMPVAAWPVYILLLALILSAAILSELRVRPLLRRSMVALPFALAALPLLLTVPGQTAVALRLGPLHLAVTVPGVERFASIVVRSWLSVQVAILLTATTQLPDLLVAMGQLHMPRLLVAILSLMWRYLAVLVDEAIRMMRARDARSASWSGRGGGTLAWRASVTGSMAGSLFLRGLERSERIHNAMLSRGYDGSIRGIAVPPLDWRSRLLVLLGLIVVLALLLFGYWVA